MKLHLLLTGLLTLITSVAFASELFDRKPLLSVSELHKLLEEDPFAVTVVDMSRGQGTQRLLQRWSHPWYHLFSL